MFSYNNCIMYNIFFQAAIVDQEGRPVPRGERGELLVRGYLVMPGYWDDRDKTNECISSDRWYRAG